MLPPPSLPHLPQNPALRKPEWACARWLRPGLRNSPQQPADGPTGTPGHCCVVLGGDFGSMDIGASQQTLIRRPLCSRHLEGLWEKQ